MNVWSYSWGGGIYEDLMIYGQEESETHLEAID